MSFLLAIGVDLAVRETTPRANRSPSPLPSLHETLKRCGRGEDLIDVSPSIGAIEIENGYDQVDNFICRLTTDSTEYNRVRPAEEHVCYFIAVCWKGDAKDESAMVRAPLLLSNMMRDNRASLENLPVAVLITAETYARILPKFQDTYRSSTEINGIKVHQRFREGAARCFVISPIGDEGSATRKRADDIFETYIKPACDGTMYRAVRGEMMRGERITPDIIEALHTSPMVIAYLGNPKQGWNPNVMYEYGRRAALALPVVLLKDEGSPLPFDLKDERCVDLPETTPTDIGQVAPKIRTIRQYIEDPIRKPGWKTTYPSATVDIVIGGQKDQNKYIEASSALEALFELNEITGRTLDGVIDHLAKKMARDQCTAFLGDQQRILGNLVLGKTQPVDISANVPILFDDHATLRGRAYLPIIVSHVFIQATNTFRLNVVYIEVTAATRKRDQEKYFECTLIGAVLDPAAG